MKTWLSFAIAVLLSACLGATAADARAVRNWSYDDLLAASDAVAVVEPVANENNDDQWEWAPQFAQGVTTTFHVLCYLKGGGPGDKTTIRVKHFVYKDGEPPNGGAMINFIVGPLNVNGTFTQNGKSEPWKFERLQPHWLAFLKKMPDGSFAPVSGQIDPAFSFLELHHSSMFDPTHGQLR